ncbi:uncharacterized protein LOC128677118 [Plodia interpunctella]|uniref:uncharacterized protein LOC128677118 n=1 Tax=Plodia interpunctella TaxID=58824 RepID=UPI0023679C86|nr:uncharacterized protein LOC128677118 [Plodia interpunctella]
MSAQVIEYIKSNEEEEYLQLNQMDIAETEVIDDGDEGLEHWEQNNITLMLNLYIQNLDKFRTPKIKKKNIWVDIANAVGKSPDGCDKKFRNLKQTYIRLLKKKNKNQVSEVKWPYFELFEEIFNVNGELQPEIQQRIQDTSTENVAKVLLSMNNHASFEPEVQENGESSTRLSEEAKHKLSKKRYLEFRKVTLEMRDRQRIVEEKLDKLINIVEESNSIQRERNRLFQQFLEKMNAST